MKMDELRDVRKRISKRRGGYGEEKAQTRSFSFAFFNHVIMAAYVYLCACIRAACFK